MMSDASYLMFSFSSGFSGLTWWFRRKRNCLQFKRPRFDPWVGKIPWSIVETDSSIVAWKIPWSEEPGGLQSRGLQRVEQE